VLAATVVAIVATVVASTLALSRFVATWVSQASHGDHGAAWASSVGGSLVELFFASVALAAALAAVLPRSGRRPPYVAVLAIASATAGCALSDAVYMVVLWSYAR
jgi:hypothetical protein